MGTDAIFDPKAIEKARAGETYYSEAVFQGEQVRVLTAPAERFGVGFVGQFARELRDYNALARVQWLTLLTVLPFALILAALGGRFLTGRAMRPIADMGEAAARIGGGDFDRRIPVAGDDEFATLGVRFNEMATSLGVSFANQRAAYERLEQAYEQQRRFVGDASHELRTPLTRLQLATSEALADPSSDSKKALAVADESARAMAKLVKQLLDLAKADAGELKPVRQEVDLRALVADVVHDLPEGQPEVTLDLPDQAVSVSVDPDQIARVILNLVDNARRYTSADGTITVRVRDGMFEVRDTGEGIAPEHLPHVRERFYRADAARSREAGGAGLGLAIIDEIVAAHSGSLEIESQPGVGTVVRVNV
jgi:signal transduction histidine kinase